MARKKKPKQEEASHEVVTMDGEGAQPVPGVEPTTQPEPEAAPSHDAPPEAVILSTDEWPAVEAALAVAAEVTQAASDPEWQSTEPKASASQPRDTGPPAGHMQAEEGCSSEMPGEPPPASVPANPVGRPSIYTDELAATICTRLSSGESLRSICRDDGMPALNTIMGWVFRNPEFMKQYRLAREMQAELMADEMQEIADDGSNDWMEKHNSKGEFIGWMENGEAIKRSQLRINTRQWIAARLLPKRWGDKQQTVIQNPDGTPIVPQASIDPRVLSPEAREALKAALTTVIRGEAQDASFTEEDGK